MQTGSPAGGFLAFAAKAGGRVTCEYDTDMRLMSSKFRIRTLRRIHQEVDSEMSSTADTEMFANGHRDSNNTSLLRAPA